MTLVDTSVWIDHLRRRDPRLASLLAAGRVLCHPFVIGELACGVMRNRSEVLALLAALQQAQCAEHAEALAFVERHDLAGAGLGWIDVHLLSAAVLARASLWTLDRNLSSAASRLGLS